MSFVRLSDENAMVRQTVRDFVTRELLPYEKVLIQREIAGEHGASPGLSRDERRELQQRGRRSGLWGIDTPEELGGADLPPLTQALIFEELGRTFVDFEFGGSALPTLYGCNEEQRRDYLVPTIEGERQPCIAISEPGGGSDVRAMRTTARREGDNWVLNGEKTWITHADYADFAIVFARTSTPDGDGITSFLVDRQCGWTSSPIPIMGCRDKVGSVHFDNVVVPDSAVLGDVNQGFARAMGFIYRNRAFVLSAKNLGTAARLLEMAIDWARNRSIQGKPLTDYQNVAFAIAECESELRAAKLLVYHAATVAGEGLDYRHDAYVNKVYVARMVNRVVDHVLQIHGAVGYAKESPIERWYRDLRVERIYDGSDEVNLQGIARNLFKGNVRAGEIFARR